MDDQRRERLVYPVAAIVLIAWAVSVGYGLATKNFESLTFTTPMMGAVVAYALGMTVRKNGGGK